MADLEKIVDETSDETTDSNLCKRSKNDIKGC